MTETIKSRTLNILIIENDETDAIILTRVLRRTELDISHHWVENINAMEKYLNEKNVDLIISDFRLQQDTAIDVLKWVKTSSFTIPVIVVSHQIGEKSAVEVMKTGASDVVNKVDYKHLVASISKELLKIDRQFEREKLTTKIIDIDKERQQLKTTLEKLKNAQDESKQLLAQLNKIFESSPDGIRVIDNDFNVLRVNANYLRYNGISQGTSQTKKCHETTPQKWCHTKGCPLTRILSGETKIEEQVKRTDSKGIIREFMLSAFALTNEDGEIDGIVEYLRDVTQWHQMQTQILHAQKMESIGQLAAGIAHEINTPTQFVGDNISFLKDSFNDLLVLLNKYETVVTDITQNGYLPSHSEQIEQALEEADIDFIKEEIPLAITQAEEGTTRISSIVKAMKEFSHPGSEESELFNINQNIQSTVTVARNEWKYVSRVEMDFGFKLPAVRGYPGEFNQTILNMIVNSAHAIETKQAKHPDWKGKIKLKTYSENKNVVIEISDNGNGIPSDVVDRIFDPFFTTKSVGKGTGQGLAIAHSSIVDKHHGTIQVESAIGEGTKFTITLPTVELKDTK